MENFKSFSLKRMNQQDVLIIFFHGVGDSHLNYQCFFDEPSLQDYDLFVADLLGHGFSATSNHDDFSTQVAVLAEEIKSLVDSYKKIIFVPHSMGGIHATLLAADYFPKKISGMFAVETSITQYGSFISEKVMQLVEDNKNLSTWFETFKKKFQHDNSENKEIFQNYWQGLQLVKEKTFFENALEMRELAIAVTDENFTHEIGCLWANLSMPKVYCMGDKGNQMQSVPFLNQHNIVIEYFPTDCHWVAQACLKNFSDKLIKFVQSISG